jgi:hypothetical protein
MRVALYALVAVLTLGGLCRPQRKLPVGRRQRALSVLSGCGERPGHPATAPDPVPAGRTQSATMSVVSDAGEKVQTKVAFGDQLGGCGAVTGRAAPTGQLQRRARFDMNHDIFSPDDTVDKCNASRTDLSVLLQPGGVTTSTFWIVAEDAITPNSPAGDTSKLANLWPDVFTGTMDGTTTWAGPRATGCTDGAPVISEVGKKC